MKAAYAKAHEAKKGYEAAKFKVEVIRRKSQIEEVFWRFPMLGRQIFDQLNNKSLSKCPSVSKWWAKFIDNEKAILIRKIQEYISLSEVSVRKSLQTLSSKTLRSIVYMLKFINAGSFN